MHGQHALYCLTNLSSFFVQVTLLLWYYSLLRNVSHYCIPMNLSDEFLYKKVSKNVQVHISMSCMLGVACRDSNGVSCSLS